MISIPNPILKKIFETNAFETADGTTIQLVDGGGIAWDLAEALHRLVKERRPARVLEIGMGLGVSTLSILTGLEENGGDGSLTSIDPYQNTQAKNTGVENVRKCGLQARHNLMSEPDFTALPKLLATGEKFDFIYIDGNHDFDYVIVDYFYCDLLLKDGALMGFNDCGWRTVHAALKQIPPRTRYEEVDCGLKPDYRGKNFLTSMERRLTKRSSSDRYFKKLRSA